MFSDEVPISNGLVSMFIVNPKIRVATSFRPPRRQPHLLSCIFIIHQHYRCHFAVTITQRARKYDELIQNAFKTIEKKHERLLLNRCCVEWKEVIPRDMAAVKIQALWRGGRGRVQAEWVREREKRFEKVVELLRS